MADRGMTEAEVRARMAAQADDGSAPPPPTSCSTTALPPGRVRGGAAAAPAPAPFEANLRLGRCGDAPPAVICGTGPGGGAAARRARRPRPGRTRSRTARTGSSSGCAATFRDDRLAAALERAGLVLRPDAEALRRDRQRPSRYACSGSEPGGHTTSAARGVSAECARAGARHERGSVRRRRVVYGGAMRPTTDLQRTVAPSGWSRTSSPAGTSRRPSASSPQGQAGEGRRLLGATGTGKSATTAWLSSGSSGRRSCSPQQDAGRPADERVPGAPAAQRRQYFVSYYDYYQPEAYIPQRDIYIEKDARSTRRSTGCGSATSSLVSRRRRDRGRERVVHLRLGPPKDYSDDDGPCHRSGRPSTATRCCGSFDRHPVRAERISSRSRGRSCRGDVVEVWPGYEEFAYRIELWGDEVDKLSIIDPVTNAEIVRRGTSCYIYPAEALRPPQSGRMRRWARSKASSPAAGQVQGQGKLLEAQELRARTRHDIELMRQVGYCPGIDENYCRSPGRPQRGSRRFTC